MPVIPKIQRKVSIPGGGANAFGDVSSAGIVGKALEQGGNQIFNQYDQILQRQQEEKDQIDKIKYTTDYSNLLNQYEIDKRSNEQGELAIGITNRSVTNLESMANDFLEKNVPERIRPQMGAILKQLNDRSLDKFTTFEIHQREVYRRQTAKNAINTAAGQIASLANSPIDINNTLADTIAKLESLKVPQFEIDKASSGLISIAIETNANNGNFKEAESLINEHKELLDAHGVRDTMVNMIKTKRKQAEILARESQEEAITAQNKAFQAKYLDGKLNPTDIMSSSLSEAEKTEWLDQLNDIPESYKTDKGFELRLWTKIMENPESVSEREIMRFAGHGLSMEDAKGLISVRNSRINGDPERQANIQSVIQELKIDKAEGVFSNTEYLKQVETFKKWLKANPNEPPEAYRERILSPRKMTKVQEWLAWIPGVNPGAPNPRKTREDIEGELGIVKPGKKPAINMSNPPKTGIEERGDRKTQISPNAIRPLLQKHFGAKAAQMEKIIEAETHHRPGVYNITPDGRVHIGLLQISSVHFKDLKKAGIIDKPEDLFDPETNIKAGKWIFNKQGLRAWDDSKDKWGGKKVVGYSGGKPVYDLGNGKWQIGG